MGIWPLTNKHKGDVMNKLRKRTAFLLIDHRRVFNQNPSKRALMDHIKALQDRVDVLEKIVEGVVYEL